MKPMRAFAVTEESENSGAIYYARHDITARKAGADEFADGELSYVTCHRAPWADAYAASGRPIPARLMIAHGWHFECYGCGRHLDEDTLRDRRLPVDGVIGTQHGAVYCCARCRRKHLSRERRREAEKQRAIEAYKTLVRRRFHDVVFTDDPARGRPHVWVTFHHGQKGWLWEQVCVAFTFPGMKFGPAMLRLPDRPWLGYAPGNRFIGPLKPEYSCCHGDREAFEAWARSTVPA